MARAERAKIFAPFDAMKGFREELEKREHVYVPKVELSEDALEELDYTFSKINRGDMVSVVFYHDECYERITGKVSGVSDTARFIKIVQREVALDDIREITIL